MQGIYQIRNRANGKKYIGSSKNIEGRQRGHRRSLENRKHGNLHLQNAWDEYGEKSFVFEVVEEVLGGKETILVREQARLDKGFEQGILYNIARKADWPPNHKGRRRTEEHCANMSRALMGHKVAEEARAKISETNRGNEKHAKFYPAFYNEKTKAFIPVGKNLAKMCRERNLTYNNMWNVKRLSDRATNTGWRLATEQETRQFSRAIS